jgi:hypothetical protein
VIRIGVEGDEYQLLFETGLEQAAGIETELGSAIGKLRRSL